MLIIAVQDQSEVANNFVPHSYIYN